MTYGSLVNMIVSYRVTLIPMDNIWSLVDMVLDYSVMVIPKDDIRVIGQCEISLQCHGNTHG